MADRTLAAAGPFADVPTLVDHLFPSCDRFGTPKPTTAEENLIETGVDAP
jgi:hypothetical protein